MRPSRDRTTSDIPQRRSTPTILIQFPRSSLDIPPGTCFRERKRRELDQDFARADRFGDRKLVFIYRASRVEVAGEAAG